MQEALCDDQTRHHGVEASLSSSRPAHDLVGAVAALDAAERQQRPVDMAMALLRVGRCLRAQGDFAAAEWYLQRGLAWSRTLASLDLCIETLCELASACSAQALVQQSADAHAAYGSRERARDHAFEAASLAERRDDARCEAAVLSCVCDVLERCGDFEDRDTLRLRRASLLACARA